MANRRLLSRFLMIGFETWEGSTEGGEQREERKAAEERRGEAGEA